MEKVTGIGGVFFRAQDPKALADWYSTHLGINKVPDNYNDPAWQQQAGPTVFAPFAQTTKYFGDPAKQSDAQLPRRQSRRPGHPT